MAFLVAITVAWEATGVLSSVADTMAAESPRSLTCTLFAADVDGMDTFLSDFEESLFANFVGTFEDWLVVDDTRLSLVVVGNDSESLGT